MAFTAPTAATSLNFLDLPAEIQKNIFLKYLEDPCTITFRNPGRWATNLTMKPKFGPEARIAWVDKHFFEETMEALKTSPHTIIVFGNTVWRYQASFAYRDEYIKAFTRHTRTIHTRHFLLYEYPSPYLRLAPKLNTVHVVCDSRVWMRVTTKRWIPAGNYFAIGEWENCEVWGSSEKSLMVCLGRELGKKSLRCLVRGEEDPDITTKIAEIFGSLPSGGPTFVFTVFYYTAAYWPHEAPKSSALGQGSLRLSFEVTASKSTITGMELVDWNKVSMHTPPEAIGETMDRLAEQDGDRTITHIYEKRERH